MNYKKISESWLVNWREGRERQRRKIQTFPECHQYQTSLEALIFFTYVLIYSSQWLWEGMCDYLYSDSKRITCFRSPVSFEQL
jgi:hypothetical protein